MLSRLQDTYLNRNLGKSIKNIFLLEDNISNESDLILIEDNFQFYQLFFDENVLFLHEINMDMESFVEDMDKRIIFQLSHKNNLSIRLIFKGKFLLLESLCYDIKFQISNDLFSYPIVKIKEIEVSSLTDVCQEGVTTNDN